MNASPLPAYMQCPIVRESRLVRDLTMPQVGNRYEEPAYKRNPGFVTHARGKERVARRNRNLKPGNISYLLRAQA